MRKWILRLIAAFFLIAVGKLAWSFYREQQIKQLKPGMTLSEVQDLLGPGQENTIKPDTNPHPNCKDFKEYIFRGNPQSSNHIAVFVDSDGKVCEIVRFGEGFWTKLINGG